MLINLRNALMAGKRLPYDAEVEFLESTGTQWINTGVVSSGIDVKCLMAFTDNTVANQGVFGSRVKSGDTGSNAYQIWYNISSNNLRLDWASYAKSATVSLDTPVRIEAYQNGSVFVNGTEYTGNTKTANAYNFYIFNFNQGGALGATGCRAKVYSFQIWQNGVLVRDFIPVRKGTVGYLYDRVSGKLFGNAGTGDFVVGQDVVPVEYLQSSGTQWIDTGVVPAANDTYTVETRKNNASQDNASFGLAGCVYCFSNGRSLTGYGTFWGHIALGQGGKAGVNPLGDTNWHTIVASPTSVTVDSLPLGNRVGDAQSPLSTVKLFARGNNSASGGVAKQYNGMISHAFINRGSSDLRKFYAVRVGTEGAMMDVLTRRIYRNAGTGAFGYGNDLKYPIPAE